MGKNTILTSRGAEASTLFSFVSFDLPPDLEHVRADSLFLNEPTYENAPRFKAGDLILNRYEVLELLNGGMGQVYGCFDLKYSLKVAVKTILPSRLLSPAALASFFGEVSNCISLKKHRNIAPIYRAEMIDGYPYLISQWIEGDPVWGNSVQKWLDSGFPFTADTIVKFVMQVCEGMAHCSSQLSTAEQPFVHGDLKPDNILVDQEHTFKINDFGVRGMTAEYASPEQKLGQRLDTRSDIYSLGLCIKRLLDAAEPSCAADRDRLACLSGIAYVCLSLSPDDRYPSFPCLKQEAAKLCADPASSIPSGADHRMTITEQADRVYSQINMGLFDGDNINDCIGNPYLTKLNIYDFKDYVTGSDMSYYKGEAARLKGDYKEAAEHYKRALMHADGKAARACDGLGLISQAMGNDTEALKLYGQAISNEMYFPALYHEVELLLQRASTISQTAIIVRERVDALASLLSQGSRGYHIYTLLGRYHQVAGNSELASHFYQECLQYPSGDDWLNIYRYGQCEYAMQNVSKAAAIFRVAISAITDDPRFEDNPLKLTTLINCCYYIWDDARALALMDLAESKYRLRTGYACMRLSMMKDSDDAKMYMERLSLLSQSDRQGADLAADTGALLAELTGGGRQHSCRLVADMAVVIASRQLAALCAAGDYTAGIAACDSALSFDHFHPGTLINRGICCAELGDLREALKYYNLAIQYETDMQKRQQYISLRDALFTRFESSRQPPRADCLRGPAPSHREGALGPL